ncbi:hypothetical protein AB1Y20_005110 [Prymnesium parvum]|uniref:Uncharacterized protein n=1 Tax=Prymnesium parvum TaxID=97485 RepID=A0AB34J4Y6_PRYPA
MSTMHSVIGVLSDGNALYEWVITHADDHKASSQLILKESLKKLVISPNASADDVDEVLRIIQVSWPKIKGYDNSTPAESIEYALGLFPSTYVRMSYIAALMVHQDGGGRWQSFSEFRTEVVERLKCMDVREGPPAEQTAFPAVHASHAKSSSRMHASACKTCDMSFCDGRTCVVFNESAPVKATGSAKKLVYYLRMYAKEKKLSNMKGVRPPDDCMVQNTARQGKEAQLHKGDRQDKQIGKDAHRRRSRRMRGGG